MAFRLSEHTHDAGQGLTAFHLHETTGGRNSAVYVIVPTPSSPGRVSLPLLRKSARAAAKKALMDAAAKL